jgi:GNAT superfamily N-acetyltransferase
MGDGPVVVRPMGAADAGAVAALSGQLGYPATAPQIAGRLEAARRDPGGGLYVAEAEGRVLGWIHVVAFHDLESDPYAEIAGLVVDAGARRRGVGLALLEAAEGWARERGYREIRVRSNTARAEARPFYLKRGFTIVKTQYVFQKPLAS